MAMIVAYIKPNHQVQFSGAHDLRKRQTLYTRSDIAIIIPKTWWRWGNSFSYRLCHLHGHKI